MHSAVNPGLDFDVDQVPSDTVLKKDKRFRDAVEGLFGTTDPVVITAVERFLRREAGDLDHHRLRFIAAAAPLFGDKNHVAYMIDQLAMTQMNIAMSPLDIAVATQKFAAALDGYRPETMRKLILDLVHRSTVEILEHSPLDRVPEGGREILRDEVRKTITGAMNEESPLVRSKFVTVDMAIKALNEAEKLIESAENASPPTRVPIDQVAFNFFPSFEGQLTDTIPPDQLERAWQLFERCKPGVGTSRLLELIASNPRMCNSYGPRLLDWLDQNEHLLEQSDSDEVRGQLVAMSEVDEQTARRAIRAGAIEPFDHADTRLYMVRLAHYEQDDILLEPMTSDQLDRALTNVPVSYLLNDTQTARMIRAMNDPDCLRQIAELAASMDPGACIDLISHPMVGEDVVERVIRDLESNSLLDPSVYLFSGPLEGLLESPKLNDRQLDHILSLTDHSNDITTMELLRLAAGNPSAGELVCHRLLNSPARFERRFDDPTDARVLDDIAAGTASTTIHEVLTDVAIQTRDSDLARSLMSNGVIRAPLWERLDSSFPSPHMREVRDLSRPSGARLLAYDASDVADLVIADQAPPGRVTAILDAAIDSPVPLIHGSGRDVVSVLGDHGRIPEVLAHDLFDVADRHVALRFATDPSLRTFPGTLVQQAETELTDTATVSSLQGTVRPKDKGLRSWGQLPNSEHLPLPRGPIHDLIDKEVVDGVKLTTPKSRSDVTELAQRMGNCVGGYKELIASGQRVLAHTNDGKNTYAVMWDISLTAASENSSGVELWQMRGERESPADRHQRHVRLRVDEINSRFNKNEVPDWFIAAVHELTGRINDGTLLAAHSTARHEHDEVPTGQLVVDSAPGPAGDGIRLANTVEESEAGPERARQRAPARRQPIPRLRSHVDDVTETDDGPAHDVAAEAPSLLGRQDSGRVAGPLADEEVQHGPITHEVTPDLGIDNGP